MVAHKINNWRIGFGNLARIKAAPQGWEQEVQ